MRDARLWPGHPMHRGNLTLEQGAAVSSQGGFQSRKIAGKSKTKLAPQTRRIFTTRWASGKSEAPRKELRNKTRRRLIRLGKIFPKNS